MDSRLVVSSTKQGTDSDRGFKTEVGKIARKVDKSEGS